MSPNLIRVNNIMALLPAYNEAGSIGHVIEGVKQVLPQADIVVIDDCSTDNTVQVARDAGATVVCIPCNLGIGGAVQTGFKFAREHNYDVVIRLDGDGQHDPRDIPKILEALKSTGAEMVIGSRFLDGAGEQAGLLRSVGIRFFRLVLRPILGRPVRDPTSGFVGVNRAALEVFSRSFPLEYPEIEALVVLQRRAFRFHEVPCRFRPRRAGKSTITALKSLYYIVHVLLGVFVNVLKYEGGREKR